ELAQRGDVVEDPEAASMGTGNEVGAVNGEIADRSRRQIQLQRLPVVAIVERNIDGMLGAGEEQAAAHGIFAYSVDGGIVGNAGSNLLPALAAIASAIDVSVQIIEAETIDGGI